MNSGNKSQLPTQCIKNWLFYPAQGWLPVCWFPIFLRKILHLKTVTFHIRTRWYHCKMTQILYIILISISIWSCSQKFHSTEFGENFSEIEIKDLHRLTEFFQVQMCGTTNNFPACIDSLLPHLQEYGNCRRGLQGSFYSENIALRNFGITIMRVNID